MSTMKAVVVEGKKAVVKEDVPVPPLGNNMALIKVRAVATNPTDWKHVEFGIGPQGSILGCDAAGDIVKLGPGVDETKWKVGDSLAVTIHGASIKHPENGAFAEYARVELGYAFKLNLKSANADKLPAGPVTTYEAASSLPVSVLTANDVLVRTLGAKLQWEPANTQKDHSILIWGGATSAGFHLIQISKKLNIYKNIVVVASKKNEELLKSFGADYVYDYHDDDVIERITAAHDDLYDIVDAVSLQGTLKQCFIIATDKHPVTIVGLAGTLDQDLQKEDLETKPNVKVTSVLLYQVSGEEVPFGPMTIPKNPEVREKAIEFAEFIRPRLADGSFKHIPISISRGIDSVPEIMALLQSGKNSAAKLVARL